MKTYLLKSIVVLLLTLACAFTASATETYRGNNNGSSHKGSSRTVTNSVTHNGSHHSGTHHNSHQPQ